jgi:WD40 repeat protein
LKGHSASVSSLNFSRGSDVFLPAAGNVGGDDHGGGGASATTATLVSSGWDGHIRLWDLHTMKCRSVLVKHRGPVLCTALGQRASNLLLSGGADQVVRVWDVRAREALGKLRGHEGTITSLAITSDGHQVVSSSMDKTAKIWDLRKREPTSTLAGHTQVPSFYPPFPPPPHPTRLFLFVHMR